MARSWPRAISQLGSMLAGKFISQPDGLFNLSGWPTGWPGAITATRTSVMSLPLTGSSLLWLRRDPKRSAVASNQMWWA